MNPLERILHSTELDDKFLRCSLPHSSADIPAFPARAHGLKRPPSHRKLPALRPRDVDDEQGRRRILHELANHELQAIELLAMALVRWPEAPKGLRRGLLSTLHDEQRHCQLYLARLNAFGGQFGEVPVSTFFWDTLHTVPTIEGFIAGLSLCFEVANLDFALAWKRRFERAHDADTAAVLHTVLEDEIRHVSLGLAWFSELGSGDRIDAWQQHLPSPLTPAHARGTVFNTDARLRAGFDRGEIRRLEILGGHRSQAPRHLIFDAAHEDRVVARTPRRHTRSITDQLAHLPLFLARPADIVVAPEPPADFLDALAIAGFALPRFDPAAIPDVPWGPRPGFPGWQPEWAALSDKTATLAALKRLPAHPLWVEDLGEVWTEERTPEHADWVLKAPFSASGTLRIRGSGPLTSPQQAWVARQLRAHSRLLYMPWYPTLADVSVHLRIGDNVRIDGITRFATEGGRFIGAWPRPWIPTLPGHQRALHGNGNRSLSFDPALRQIGAQAGAWAQQLGYQGPLSIDALIVTTDDGLRLHPWLETNARCTLGRVALALRARIHPRSRAFWHVGKPLEQPRELVIDQGRIVDGTLRTTPGSFQTWIDVRTQESGLCPGP